MNEGLFRSQINTGWEILKKLGLGADIVYSPKTFSKPASFFRNLTYLETWIECYQNQYYNFQLTDNSLIQFSADSFRPLALRYTYYECPYQALLYSEFLIQNGFDPREVGDELLDDYETYLSTLDTKETFTPIRYDFSPSQYQEGHHPASHIHFGHKSHIRIGTKKVLRPISFLLLIIRQCYPDHWRRLLPMESADLWCRNVREHLNDIDDQFWRFGDSNEMYLI